MGAGGEDAAARTGRRTVAGLDPETATVHEAVSAIPGAQRVFERHGIDACCGGGLPLVEAAEAHGRLLDALEAARAAS